MIPVTVIRSPREKIAKCSLRFLHDRPEFTFLRADEGFRFDARGYTLLALDAPPIGPADADRPLLLLDSTWRILPRLENVLHGEPVRRSLPPGIQTAYPRRSKLEPDPDTGLASVEALFAAKVLLGEMDLGLLEGYHWRDAFLENLRAAGVLEDEPSRVTSGDTPGEHAAPTYNSEQDPGLDEAPGTPKGHS